jgi:hypothetical protein
MTQKMMRLFDTVSEATTYIKNETGWTQLKSEQYVNNSITMRNGDKVWVVLP